MADGVYSISYSQLKVWNACPFYHKLVKIDKISVFESTLYTAFGTALHAVAEKLLPENTIPKEMKDEKAAHIFCETFDAEVAALVPDSFPVDLKDAMRSQGSELATEITPALHAAFPNVKVFATEEEIRMPIEGVDGFEFLGYIDLVLETTPGHYVILDWKTTSWGWDARKKSDKLTSYQPTLYKHFWCRKHNVPVENVELYFGIIKRTAKKDRIEFFKTSAGKIKIKNAVDMLRKACINIQRKVCIKNKTSCLSFGDTKRPCPFFKTEHCW